MSFSIQSVNVQRNVSNFLFVTGGVKAAQAAVKKILGGPQVSARETQTLQQLGTLPAADFLGMAGSIMDISQTTRTQSAARIITLLSQSGSYETGLDEEGLGMPSKRISIYPLGNRKTGPYRMRFGNATENLAKQHGFAFGLNSSIDVELKMASWPIDIDLAELVGLLPDMVTQNLTLLKLNRVAANLCRNYRDARTLLTNKGDLAIGLQISGLGELLSKGTVISGAQIPGNIPTVTLALHNPMVDGGYLFNDQAETALSYAKAIAKAFQKVLASGEALKAVMQGAIPSTPQDLISQPIHPAILNNNAQLRAMFMTVWQEQLGLYLDQQDHSAADAKIKEIINIWEERGYIDPGLVNEYEIYELVGNAVVKALYKAYPPQEAKYHFTVMRYLVLANTIDLALRPHSAVNEEMTAIIICLKKTPQQIAKKYPQLKALKEYIDSHPMPAIQQRAADLDLLARQLPGLAAGRL